MGEVSNMNATRTICLFTCLTCLYTMAFRSAFAEGGPPPVLNPAAYVSPSGTCSLTVDPTDLYGRGPADYRCTKDGNVVWAHRLPYTLWKASVADSGQVVGYAYTHGWSGVSEEGASAGPGEFIVSLLSPDGKLLNEERYTRQWSRALDMPPNPLARGTIHDESNNRILVRVADPDVSRHIEQWWIYDLESGRRVSILEPGRFMPQEKGDVIRSILRARPVPGTPLILTHWWKYASGNCGGVFTLVDLSDAKAKPVWSFVLDGDYSVPGNEEAEDDIRQAIRKDGAILDADKPFGFTIHAVKQHQWIAFSVQKAENGGWTIRETARTPYDLSSSKPSQAAQAFPPIQLNELAVVQLGGRRTRTASSIRDLRGFGFDAEGGICVLSGRDNSEPHLLQITEKGDVLKDLRMPVGELLPDVDFAGPAHVGGGKFVVTISDSRIEGRARCFVADFQAETITELSGFRCSAVTALAGFPDGRFAALIYDQYNASHRFSLFDAQGNPVWQKEESGYRGKPAELHSPRDITRYGDESIAVLDESRHAILLFDAKGVFLRSIDLSDARKHEESYPRFFEQDSEGGFAVYYFDTPSALVRTDANGRVQNECSLKFSDGRPVALDYGVRRAPNGRLWTTDGDVLLRLSDDGTVDRILGEEAGFATIHRPSYAVVGPNECVYVADGRNSAVHVFDGHGDAKGVCVPDSNDLTEFSYVQHIAASAEGDVFVSLGCDDNTYVQFDANLKRAGSVEIDLTSVSQDWYFKPAGTLCWVVGYEDVFLVKDLRSVVRKISRRADGMWLESPSTLGVAPDGSAAVLAASQSGEVSVNTYGPDGDPRATYVGPREWSNYGHVAYDGQCAYFRSENDVYVIRPDTGPIGCFRLPSEGAKDPWEGPFVAAQGKQLWFVDRERLTLHKFAVWSK